MAVLKLAVVALLACAALAQDNSTDEQYASAPAGGSMDPSGLLFQQQNVMKFAKFWLDWTTAMAFSQYSQSQMSLFYLDQEATADENTSFLEEEEEDVGPLYGFQGSNPFSAGGYGSYGNFGGYGAGMGYGGGMGYGAPAGSAQQDPEQLELQGEFALAYALKVAHVMNFHDLAEAQLSHLQDQIAIMALSASGNPLGMQVAYFLKYKDVLDTIRSSLKIQMHDVWNQWNLQEIIETQEFKRTGEAVSDGYFNAMTASKLYSMHIYQMDASIELQRLFIDMYVQQVISAAAGPQAAAGSPATPQGAAEGYAALLEIMSQAEAEPADPAQPSKPFIPALLLAQPQLIVYWYLLMQFYEKFLNYNLAQTWFRQAQLEMASIHLDEMEGVQDFDQMQRYVDMQTVYALSQWSSVKLMLAYIEFLVLAVPAFAAAFGSFGQASLGTGSIGGLGSLAPALAIGSLGPVGGSLALGGSLATGSLGSSLGSAPLSGSAPFAAAGASNFVVTPPANAAAMAFANLLQQGSASQHPSAEASAAPFPAESFNVAA